jgi:NitT/TauT family transport system substrate-binding protein
MKTLNLRKRDLLTGSFAATLLAAASFALIPAGCGSSTHSPGGPTKLTVAYLGLTCEAPIFVAKERGFFEEEGLDVELERTNWDGLREGLGTGRFDANHTLIMYLLKGLENRMDVKITGGIHTGCLRLQARKGSDIDKVADFRGKKIGVPTHLLSPPHMFACRVLAANGIDPNQETKQVEWLTFDPGDLEKALKDERIDGVATTDPIGTILVGKNVVKTIADQAKDAPYADEYCCAAVVSGKLARENPEAAAKVTRALLKGAKWVHENPGAAADLGVEKKYVSSTVEYNTQALSKLNYIPAVARCRQSIVDAGKEMKLAGLLKEDSDPEELAKRAWLDLDGVSDDWVKGLKIEKVASGGPPRLLNPAEFAARFDGKICFNCCCVK